MESPPTKKFSSPEEEIAYLRARVAEREGEDARGASSRLTENVSERSDGNSPVSGQHRYGELLAEPEAAGDRSAIARQRIQSEELGAYSKFTPQSVLEKKYQLGERELAHIVERVSGGNSAAV